MKVLVTGASGFIGFHCCNQLSALGYEVHAVSSKLQTDITVQWHKVDLLDSEQIRDLINTIRPTHLLHLAWYVEPNKYWTSIKNLHWVKASLNLFEEFSKSGGKRIVVSGSCAEYDWGFSNYCEDSTPLNPNSLYGVCKHSLQLMLSSYASLTELSFAWGRIFSIYGPREHPKRLFASVIQGLLEGKNVECKSGDLIRDYLHVEDVASAFVELLKNDINGPINIASGEGFLLKDIVKIIEAKTERYDLLNIEAGALSSGIPQSIIADTRRIIATGWKPKFNINSGLDHTIGWYRDKL